MWCVARFRTICTILKNVKNTLEGVLILVKTFAKCSLTRRHQKTYQPLKCIHDCIYNFYER